MTVRSALRNSLDGDPAAPWTFTRLLTKLTLDYIYTPELADKAKQENNIPGSSMYTCSRVISPESEKVENPVEAYTYLFPDSPQKMPYGNYSFISSWKELSDHYPVFMEFNAPTKPAGTPEARRETTRAWP